MWRNKSLVILNAVVGIGAAALSLPQLVQRPAATAALPPAGTGRAAVPLPATSGEAAVAQAGMVAVDPSRRTAVAPRAGMAGREPAARARRDFNLPGPPHPGQVADEPSAGPSLLPTAPAPPEAAIEVRDGSASTPIVPEPLAFSGPATLPLTVSTETLPRGMVGQAYSAGLAATGGTPPYAWELASGFLPTGLALDGGIGLLSGVPTVDGTFQLQFTVRDGEATAATKALTLVIETSPLFIVTGSFPPATIEVAYVQRLEAQGGRPPYVWSLTAGALPEGLTLTEAQVSGVPVRSQLAVVHIMVQDQAGQTDTAEYKVQVVPSVLRVATVSVPPGVVGEPYRFRLLAEGGTPPYQWSLATGTLPPELVLSTDGQMAGTPIADGETTVTVQVTDMLQQSASQRLTLRIEGAAGQPVTGLIAAPSDSKAGLAWQNPSLAGYAETAVVRGTDHHPAHRLDGIEVYTGTGTQHVDTGLTNGTTYFYTAFAIDAQGRAAPVIDASRAQAAPQAVRLAGGAADPYADAVISASPLHPQAFGVTTLPGIVLGPPQGAGTAAGSLDVLSLGCGVATDPGAPAPHGGTVTLAFTNNLIVDGPGPDLTVFENAFFQGGDPQKRFIEPAIVAVSQDGVTFYAFPFDFVPHFTSTGQLNLANPFVYSAGFAGVNPVLSNNGTPDPTDPTVSGGDGFDLSQLPGRPVSWVRFVRITGTGDRWLTDVNGDVVRHAGDPFTRACDRAFEKSGFDLDAVAAIHY
ncbi:MAG: hypothetical protein HY597_02040 [Candidatus Omnitrophica bacterium]|nr:hypothetical protein [Candidatus Omnitrophota bacterium]